MYVLAKVTESYEDVLEKSRFEGEKRITPKFGKIYVGRSDRIITFHINITYSEPVFFKTFLVKADRKQGGEGGWEPECSGVSTRFL